MARSVHQGTVDQLKLEKNPMPFKSLTLLGGALLASGVFTQAQAAEPEPTLGFNRDGLVLGLKYNF